MKRFLFIIALFATIGASAQAWSPIAGRNRFTGGVGLPVRDSSYYNLPSDTAIIYWGRDSVIYGKYKGFHFPLNNGTKYILKTDTTAMLQNYIRTANWGTIKTGQALGVDSTLLSTKANVLAQLTGYTPMARTLTINGTTQDLTANRTWTLTTANISEVTNLYYTDTRARAALSFAAGSGAYNSTTGVITIPTNTNQLTNGNAFISLTSLSATTPLSYNNTTGAFTIGQATTTTNGYLSSTDWNTFNNKQPAGAYLLGNQTITLSGDVSGSGATAITTTIGALKVTNAMLAGTIDYAKMNAATVPTWNQSTTGTAANITATSNATLTTLSALTTAAGGAFGSNAFNSTAYLPLAGGTLNTGAVINMVGNDPANGYLSFKNNTATTPHTFYFSAGQTGVTQQGFQLYDVTAAATRMYFTDAGAVTFPISVTSATLNATGSSGVMSNGTITVNNTSPYLDLYQGGVIEYKVGIVTAASSVFSIQGVGLGTPFTIQNVTTLPDLQLGGSTYAFEGIHTGKSTTNGGSRLELLGHGSSTTAGGYKIWYDTDVSGSLQISYAAAQSTYGALSYSTIFSINTGGAAIFSGTLNSGAITSTTGVFSGVGLGTSGTTTSTSQNFVQFRNSGGDFYIGTESSTAGAFFPSSSAYANVLYGVNPIQFIISGVKKLDVTTGSVSTTVPFSIVNTTGTASLTLSRANTVAGQSAQTNYIDNSVQKWALGAFNIGTGGVSDFSLYNYGTASNTYIISYSTNAISFSSTVTASSLIKSGGTSTQYLMADGSTSTAPSGGVSSGTATGITSSLLVNISSVASVGTTYWTRVGNVVTITTSVDAIVSASGTATCSFSATLPSGLSTATTSQTLVGHGVANSSTVTVQPFVDINSSTTYNVTFLSTSAGTKRLSLIFTYTL